MIAVGESGKPGGIGAGRYHMVAPVSKQSAHPLEHKWIVINDEDQLAMGYISQCRGGGRRSPRLRQPTTTPPRLVYLTAFATKLKTMRWSKMKSLRTQALLATTRNDSPLCRASSVKVVSTRLSSSATGNSAIFGVSTPAS